MDKVKKEYSENGDRYLFRCPGCEHLHVVDSRWHFNHNYKLPTFQPSVLNKSLQYNDELDKMEPHVCHLFITNGQISFLNDCSHELAGQTVELPDM